METQTLHPHSTKRTTFRLPLPQLLPQAWLGNTSVVFGPADMKAAAGRLGISVAEGSSEWSLLWLARELLRAPLPAGWTVTPPKTAPSGAPLRPVFSCAANGTELAEHPLTPFMAAEAALMRRRLRLRMRYFRPLEPVWLFAPEAESGAAFYMDLRTGLRTATFPNGLLSPSSPSSRPADDLPSQRFKRKMSVRSTWAVQVVQGVKDAADRDREEERRAKLKVAAAEADKQTRQARREALRIAPLCAVDLMQAALALEINLSEQPELAFLAELALCTGLPAGWELLPAEQGSLASYRHSVSSVTTAKHPLVAYAASFVC